jgi:hypothetical protein
MKESCWHHTGYRIRDHLSTASMPVSLRNYQIFLKWLYLHNILIAFRAHILFLNLFRAHIIECGHTTNGWHPHDLLITPYNCLLSHILVYTFWSERQNRIILDSFGFNEFQIILWLVLWWKPVRVMVILSKMFFAGKIVVSFPFCVKEFVYLYLEITSHDALVFMKCGWFSSNIVVYIENLLKSLLVELC